MTPLDALCATPFHEAEAPARAAVLRTLADTLLFVALEGDDPEAVPPRLRLLDLGDGDRVALACDEIRIYGGGSPQVQMSMRAMLDDLATVVDEAARPPLDRQRRLLDRAADEHFAPEDRAAVTGHPPGREPAAEPA